MVTAALAVVVDAFLTCCHLPGVCFLPLLLYFTFTFLL
jgi:hypothetical protein